MGETLTVEQNRERLSEAVDAYRSLGSTSHNFVMNCADTLIAAAKAEGAREERERLLKEQTAVGDWQVKDALAGTESTLYFRAHVGPE